MSDSFHRALLQDDSIVIGITITTQLCRDVQRLHELGNGSSLALGRLLTASALTGLIQENPGTLSFQVVGSGKFGQIYADINDEGKIRGYIKNPDVQLPNPVKTLDTKRHSLSSLVGQGCISVIRIGANNSVTQSTTPITAGEIDQDIQTFIEQSDQVPTFLACETLLDENAAAVQVAGGIIVQAVPETKQDRMEEIRALLENGKFSNLLSKFKGDWKEILNEIAPESKVLSESKHVQWQCRCSYERCKNALRMLSAIDLADIVSKHEKPNMTCDFCGRHYTVELSDIEDIYGDTLQSTNT